MKTSRRITLWKKVIKKQGFEIIYTDYLDCEALIVNNAVIPLAFFSKGGIVRLQNIIANEDNLYSLITYHEYEKRGFVNFCPVRPKFTKRGWKFKPND